MKSFFLNFGSSLVSKLPNAIKSYVYANGELVLNIHAVYLMRVLFFLKMHTNTQYKILIDMTAVDFINKGSRFEVVYNLLSLSYNSRIRLKCLINELDMLDSIISLYPSANWAEREI